MSTGYPSGLPPGGPYGPPGGPYGPPGMPYGMPGQQPPPPPPNHLVMAIVTTILCCLPFGIVSIVYANQVNTKHFAGDYAGALDASNKAKTWWIVAMVGGLAAILLWAIFGLAAFSGSPSTS